MQETVEIVNDRTKRESFYKRYGEGPMSIPKTTGDLYGSLIQIRHILQVRYTLRKIH